MKIIKIKTSQRHLLPDRNRNDHTGNYIKASHHVHAHLLAANAVRLLCAHADVGGGWVMVIEMDCGHGIRNGRMALKDQTMVLDVGNKSKKEQPSHTTAAPHGRNECCLFA